LANLHQLLSVTSGYLFVSVMLSTLTAWMTATTKRNAAQSLVRDMTLALERMDEHMYTIGDAFTRFQDVFHVVDGVIGLVRDIPYTVIIWCGTVWYLISRQPTVAWVVLGVIGIIFLSLTPFVRRVRNYFYQIRLQMSQLNNSLTHPTGNIGDGVETAWRGLIATRYRQAVWGIPIATAVQQTALVGILVVALLVGFHHARPSMAVLLSLLFLVNYVISASHTLYHTYVKWQTTLPSLFRLKDLLEITNYFGEDI
jgi:ABC-type bacteriocin/lantibiotic exporter with double-glycine peptidase domain